MPTVSFLLPAYKASFLHAAIESILSQTFRDFELIIVNDASPENISEIVLDFHDDRLVYYENEKNIGRENLVRQWNEFCLPRARGEWCVMASDDDLYAPTYLEEMMRLVRKYPQCDLFHCRLCKIDGGGRILGFNVPSAEYESCLDFISQRLCHFRMQTVQEFMFRRESMTKIGGFVEFPLAFFSDDATWAELSRRGCVCSMQKLFMFRFSGVNISSNHEDSSRMLQKLGACFSYADWMCSFLKDIDCTTEEEKPLVLEIERGIVNKQIEWINWTTCRVNWRDFWKVYKNPKFRKMCGMGRWIILLLRNVRERFISKRYYL